MTTTITKATVAGIPETAEIASVYWLALLLMLVALLIGKEILMSTPGQTGTRLDRALLVAIVPLTYLFGVILVVTIAAYIR